MKPKSLYRAALLEYLFYASLTADPAEARAAYRTYRHSATPKHRRPSAAYTNLPKSPTIGAPANGTPTPLSNTAAIPPMQPTASVTYMKKASAVKKTSKRPASSTAKTPRLAIPMPNAPSVTATKKA